jgi:hypothetical protein
MVILIPNEVRWASPKASIFFAKLVDTRNFWRTVRAPMNHQLTSFCTQQRSALKVHAWNLLAPCGAPLRALDDVMR